MAKKSVRKGVKKALAKAKKGKAAKRKPLAKQVKADVKAASGAVPQMKPAEIEEAFRRFKEASPEPKTELKHVNPFTLLVAVVLSAQATDAGVNKATPALFAAADTPEKMAALGEDASLIAGLLRFTCPFDMTGSPTITLPAGFAPNGGPVAFQFVGRHFDEAALVRAGDAFQRVTDWHTRHPAL